MAPLSKITRLIVVGLLITTAGCMQVPTDSDTATSPALHTPETSNGAETPETSARSETTETSTAEPVGTADLPYDLLIRNYRDNEEAIQTTVIANATGNVLFNRSLTLAPDESSEFHIGFTEAGNYTVTTEDSTGETYRYVWRVEYTPPSYEVIVTADPRGNVTYLESSA